MHGPSRKRRRKKEIRDSIDSDCEEEDVGYMNTRETHLGARGRLLTMSVSPQKKSSKQPWMTRRAWEPPDDKEIGLDSDSHQYEDALDADVYNVPEVDQQFIQKPKRSLRSVRIFIVVPLMIVT